MTSTITVGLIACGKSKADQPSPARSLYTGPLFKAASGYAEQTYDRWYVVSALHGLVDPDSLLSPYDRTMRDLKVDETKRWAHRVDFDLRIRAGLGLHCRNGGQVVFYVHAGTDYREPLLPFLTRWAEVETPVKGLGIGEQMGWYATARSMVEVA